MQAAGKWITAPTDLAPGQNKMQHAVEMATASLDSRTRSEIPSIDQSYHRLQALKHAALISTLQTKTNISRQQKINLIKQASPDSQDESTAPVVPLRSQFYAAEIPGQFYLRHDTVKAVLTPAIDGTITLDLAVASTAGTPLSSSALLSKLVQNNLTRNPSVTIDKNYRARENEEPNGAAQHAQPTTAAAAAQNSAPTPEQLKEALRNLSSNFSANPLHA